MSIHDEIRARVKEGRLVEFETIPKMSVYRPVFLTPSVNSQIAGPWDDDDEDAVQMPYVRADLENFITNGMVTAAYAKGPKNANFRRLTDKKGKKPVVWELRTMQSNPPYRLVGLFAAVDVFIGVELVPRDMIDFEVEIRRAKTAWTAMFGSCQPVTSEKIYDYISERVVRL